MARGAAKASGGGGSSFDGAIRWAAWALALFAFASAFTTLGGSLRGGLRWALTIGAILLAGRAMGEGRRVPFFLYGVMALVLNPWRPFTMSVEVWRLALAASAVWLVADHLPRRK